ncbi:helix-turn-helix domain-containing protein [Alphaproteobacteria bacterium]|nr:helix-turn-helix domain-containing protein [Alphaproteobacteria bacterium]MDC1157563.1 helix-turn-helix domain-containing protein [Alphaproteobacteria bacterium]
MFPLLIKAVKAEGLEPPEKAILIQIADLTNQLKGKQAWPSEEYLAIKTGFCRKTVSRAKNSLRNRGILSWVSPKQSSIKNSSCIYTINEKELDNYLPNIASASLGVAHSDPSFVEEEVTESVGVGHIDPQVGSESPEGRVIESIYTPTTPIKILLSDTDRVKRLKNDVGVLTIDNWLEMACKERRYKDPRPAEYREHIWMDYQILHTEFNQAFFDLLGISENQWALGAAKYKEQYRLRPTGKELEWPNLKAFYALMRFIASPDRSDEVWAAVGGSGLPKPSLTEKTRLKDLPLKGA